MNYLKGFVADCQARGLTAHTIETYRSNVIYFLRAHNEPGTVSLEDLRAFLGELRGRGLQGSTLKGYFAAISAMYEYLNFEGLHAGNPILSFRKRYLSRMKLQSNGENSRQLISVQDLQLLLQAARDIREITLILFFAKTGMRRGEVLGLKIDDIDLRRRIIHIPAKAKRSNRLAYIDDELAASLEQYISWRQKKARSSWLWITRAGGRIHKDYPGEVLADLGGALELHDPRGPLCNRLTPHCLRHFFTTHLFRAGMDPQYIKFLRGDSLSSEAWQLYNHIDLEEVRDQYVRLIPKLISFDQKITKYL